MTIDTSGAKDYLAECRTRLGDSWVTAADAELIDGARNVGGIAKEYALMSYLKGIKVATCVRDIKKRFPEMRVAWMDERFSSKMAVQAMVDGGMKLKERKKKENIDKISAAIILQSFLEEENNKGK